MLKLRSTEIPDVEGAIAPAGPGLGKIGQGNPVCQKNLGFAHRNRNPGLT